MEQQKIDIYIKLIDFLKKYYETDFCMPCRALMLTCIFEEIVEHKKEDCLYIDNQCWLNAGARVQERIGYMFSKNNGNKKSFKKILIDLREKGLLLYIKTEEGKEYYRLPEDVFKLIGMLRNKKAKSYEYIDSDNVTRTAGLEAAIILRAIYDKAIDENEKEEHSATVIKTKATVKLLQTELEQLLGLSGVQTAVTKLRNHGFITKRIKNKKTGESYYDIVISKDCNVKEMHNNSSGNLANGNEYSEKKATTLDSLKEDIRYIFGELTEAEDSIVNFFVFRRCNVFTERENNILNFVQWKLNHRDS